jgi:hypothetical protein
VNARVIPVDLQKKDCIQRKISKNNKEASIKIAALRFFKSAKPPESLSLQSWVAVHF